MNKLELDVVYIVSSEDRARASLRCSIESVARGLCEGNLPSRVYTLSSVSVWRLGD